MKSSKMYNVVDAGKRGTRYSRQKKTPPHFACRCLCRLLAPQLRFATMQYSSTWKAKLE
jgi:hypothetical protein